MTGMIVNIDVPDLDAAVSFYTAAIGLKLARLLDDDVAELTGASCPIFLLMRPEGVSPALGVTRTREYVRHWSPIHLDFVVDALEHAVKRAIDAGAMQETGIVLWRGSRCVTFSDPFGHGFCLIEFAQDTYSGD
ncbi:MAG: VOC family protein [Gammaproteobacteria bacterium]|jgi:predicted enzyme related to lactoylglutathione lyase|nr:VOC family protein [Gammaproteobacteria bacterium]